MHEVSGRVPNLCKPDGVKAGCLRAPRCPDGDRLQRASIWCILCVALIVLGFLADGPVADVFTLHSSPFWRRLAIYASKAGEGWVIAVGGIVGSSLLFLVRRFQASRVVFMVAFTSLLTGAAATVIRSLLGRTRPDSHELQGFYGVWHHSHWIIGKYEFGAFPSGHTATVIGLAAAAWLVDRRLGLLAAGYALLVSWSRIALGCHHFSDEIAAAILGIYGAPLVFAWFGPGIYSMSRVLQNAWLQRRDGLEPSTGSDRI